MATTTGEATATPEPLQCVALHGVGWAGYTRVLRARGDRRRPKMVYLDGDLYLMAPAPIHEEFADRLSDVVKVVCEELDIPFKSRRSTTFRRKKEEAGAEADASFYLQNAERVARHKDLDLRRDPPPDLTIEAVNTHEAGASVEIWRRFGVPEVWVADADRVRILTLQADGRYADASTSVAFPFLAAVELHAWMIRDADASDLHWIKAVRAWVRDVLAPQAREGA